MTRLALIFATVLLNLAPSALALTLPEALGQLENRTAVLSARTELQDATVNLGRVTQDPLALRTDVLQAEQRLDLAKAQLTATRYSTLSEIVSGYSGVLSAENQLSVARRSLNLSEQALRVARIRLESGSITAQDLRDAETAVAEAQSGVSAATEGRDLALNSLGSLLGSEVEPGSLEPIPESFLTPVPPLPLVLGNAEGSPDLLQSEQQAELAEAAANVLDPLYAPQSDIDSAASALQNAQAGVRETQRGFLLNVRNLHAQAENARQTLLLRRTALAASQARLKTQAQQLGSGLISEIVYKQAELETAQSASAALQAQSDYLNALLTLQTSSLTPLGGPYATAMSRSGE